MKKINGIVTKIIDENTIMVESTTKKKHPLYHKLFTHTKNYLVDTRDNKKNIIIGNKVVFINCRPISKKKKMENSSINNQI